MKTTEITVKVDHPDKFNVKEVARLVQKLIDFGIDHVEMSSDDDFNSDFEKILDMEIEVESP